MNKSKALKQTVRAALCAALIAVSSFIIIPISAVPVTLQTFTVCVTAALLGLKWGVVSVSVYILLGAAGLPVFSGFGGGIGVLMGAGGGFIWGFLIIAFIVGFCADKFGCSLKRILLAMSIGTLACYSTGVLWYALVFDRSGGFISALTTCVIPFILPDIVKIIAAATVASKLKKRIK